MRQSIPENLMKKINLPFLCVCACDDIFIQGVHAKIAKGKTRKGHKAILNVFVRL